MVAQRRRANRPVKRTCIAECIQVMLLMAMCRDSRVVLLLSRRTHSGPESGPKPAAEVICKCRCLSRTPAQETAGALGAALEEVVAFVSAHSSCSQ